MRTQASEKRLRAVCPCVAVCCGLVALLWTEMLLKRVKTSLCGREASRGGVAPREPDSAVPPCTHPPNKASLPLDRRNHHSFSVRRICVSVARRPHPKAPSGFFFSEAVLSQSNATMGESKGGTALAKTTAAVRRSFRRSSSRKSTSAKAVAAAKGPAAGLTPVKGADEDTSSESSKPGEGEEALSADPAGAAPSATPASDAPAAQLQSAVSWTTAAKEKPGHVVSLRKHFDSLVSTNGEVPAGSSTSYVTASGAGMHPLVRLLLKLTCTEMCFLDAPAAKAVTYAK